MSCHPSGCETLSSLTFRKGQVTMYGVLHQQPDGHPRKSASPQFSRRRLLLFTLCTTLIEELPVTCVLVETSRVHTYPLSQLFKNKQYLLSMEMQPYACEAQFLRFHSILSCAVLWSLKNHMRWCKHKVRYRKVKDVLLGRTVCGGVRAGSTKLVQRCSVLVGDLELVLVLRVQRLCVIYVMGVCPIRACVTK